MVNLEKPVEIYCPFLKAEIKLSSEITEEMGVFGEYLLWVIGNGKDMEFICSTIKMEEISIKSEIDYLCRIEFIEPKDNWYTLTAKGQKRYKFINYFYEFNDKKNKVSINAVTGKVFPYNEEELLTYEKTDNKKLKLREEITKELCENPNIDNFREYVLNNYDFSIFTEEEKVLIDVQFVCEPKSFYKKAEVKICNAVFKDKELFSFRQNIVDEDIDKEKRYKTIPVRIKVLPLKIKAVFRALDMYRECMDALEKVAEKHSELLNFQALGIINSFKEEEKLNETMSSFYIDTVSGRVSKNYNIEEAKNSLIEIPSQIDVYDIDSEKINSFLEHELNKKISKEDLKLDFEIMEPIYSVERVPLLKILD